MHAHPTKLTPQSRVMGDFLQTAVLCSELGLRQRRKSSNSNLHPNPKSTDCGGFWIRPYVQYFIWKLQTHTTDTTTEQHRGRGREIQALGRASRGHQTVQCADTFPMHRPIGGPCFYQATKSKWKIITYTYICSHTIILVLLAAIKHCIYTQHFATWLVASEVARKGATGDGKPPANSSKAPVGFKKAARPAGEWIMAWQHQGSAVLCTLGRCRNWAHSTCFCWERSTLSAHEMLCSTAGLLSV